MDEYKNKNERDNEASPVEIQNDDDLLRWMPPELEARAEYTAQKDAHLVTPKAKRIDFQAPPRGDNPKKSKLFLVLGIAMLLISTLLSAIGANGQAAVIQNGRLWFALWMIGQALSLCAFLLFLFRFNPDMRRPALLTVLGANIVFNWAAGIASLMHRPSDFSVGVKIGAAIFLTLLATAITPSFWLFLGVVRRRSTEKVATVMSSIAIAISLIGLISTIAKGNALTAVPRAYVTAIEIAQSVFFLLVIAGWPVLTRPVLEHQPGEETQSNGEST